MRNHKATELIFELSKPGRRGVALPACDVPAAAVSQPPDGTASGDRIGNRPTGQSGTNPDH